MKSLLIVLAALSIAVGQSLNYSGWNDTAAVADFNADSAGVTKAFNLSGFENIRLRVCADDTSSSGYASDSIHFHWGVEIGNIVLNSSGVRDTTWQERYVVDTFDILTAANMVTQYKTINSAGDYTMTKLFIDTVSVSGYAVQDREPFSVIPWAPIYRFWYAGLGNNITGSYVPLIFGQSRRIASNVRQQ